MTRLILTSDSWLLDPRSVRLQPTATLLYDGRQRPERTEIIMAEHRITRAQARRLFQDDLSTLSEAASSVRFRKHPDKVVTYSIQRVINYTNICNAYCSFCSFYRAPGHPEGYLLSNDEIFRKIEDGIALGVTGVPDPGRRPSGAHRRIL